MIKRVAKAFEAEQTIEHNSPEVMRLCRLVAQVSDEPGAFIDSAEWVIAMLLSVAPLDEHESIDALVIALANNLTVKVALLMHAPAQAKTMAGWISEGLPRRHRHRAAVVQTVGFRRQAPGSKSNPAAHGDVCEIVVCACGATRATNINQQHEERGTWQTK